MKIGGTTFFLLLSACERQPEFPVPEQRVTIETPDGVSGRVLDMDNPGVTRRFVRDISPDLNGSWRWAFRSPAVRINVRTEHPVKYVIDLAVAELTLRDTGPVTIEFTVNGHVLDRERYASPGEHHFEKQVPPEWINIGGANIVGAEIDKMWTAKDDGKQFGFILTRIGLAR